MFGMDVSFFTFAKPIYRPFSIPNPRTRGNSGKAFLIGLTRLFRRQQRSSTSTKRLVRAGAFLNRYLGLKPQAESFCPSFGAIATRLRQVSPYGLKPWAMIFSRFAANPTPIPGDVANSFLD